MDALELKNQVLQYINSADNKLLKMMKALAESYLSEEDMRNEITAAQQKEIDKRLKRIENGEAEFYTWEEAKKQLK